MFTNKGNLAQFSELKEMAQHISAKDNRFQFLLLFNEKGEYYGINYLLPTQGINGYTLCNLGTLQRHLKE